MNQITFDIVLSSIIFILTYIFIIWDKIDRVVVSLSGALIMVALKLITQEDAFKEIDFNTLGLLIGMMIIVLVMQRSGIFEYLAIKMVKLVKGEPIKILIILSIVTAFLSAFLDNVTTIMLILPVTLSIARDLKINPIPIIISEVFASNVGGTATLIGDPPNILIGSATGLTFTDFLVNCGVIVIPILLITTYIFVLIYRKKLVASEDVKKNVLLIDENEFLKDKKLLIKSLIVFALVIAGFLLHGVLHYESATVAMIGAILLLLVTGIKSEKILHKIEWKTIFFFVGLFILVGGLKESGAIKLLAQAVLDITGGSLLLTTMAILWIAAIASAFLDNIPFVATMIPLVKNMGEIAGMNLTPIWWALSLGACLGGNGTIIGASANVIAVGISEEHGHKITFRNFFKISFPIMLLSIVICTIYIYFRYYSMF